MASPQSVLALDAKQALKRKLKLAWLAYWTMLPVFLLFVVFAEQHAWLCLVVWLGLAVWLAAVVADAASATGMSGAVWGLGTLVLGPIGAILFPWLFHLRLHEGDMTVTKFARVLARHWSAAAFGGLVLLIAVPATQDWWREHQVEMAAKDKKQAIEQVGMDASIAGSMYAAAYKACARIGIPNVEKCAKYEGVLLQEKAAPMLASTAVGQRTAYEANCKKLYDEKYCYDLLNRAFHLSRSEP